MNDFSKALSDMIPKSLDEIIRVNRHRVELRLATDQELSAIAGDVPASAEKDELSDYRLVSILIQNPPTVSVHLLGKCSTGQSWATSGVVTLDLTHGYALTRAGSLYKLQGMPKADQPDSSDLIFFCALMNQWGLGNLLGLPAFDF